MLQNDYQILALKRLKMPPFVALAANRIDPAEFGKVDIGRIGKNSWPVGFELQLYESHASQLLLKYRPFDCLGLLGVDYEESVLAKFYRRPPSELAAYYIWDVAKSRTVSAKAVRETNRILGGGGILRKGQLTTTKFRSGHVVQFDCTQNPATFLEDWVAQFNAPVARDEVIPKGIWLFLDLLVAHPFSDGNGRTARLLLQAYLHANGALPGPILPLGPCLQVNQRAFINAALGWEVFGHPLTFFEFMDHAIRTTWDVSRSILLQNG